jgi:hypothetical protein
MFEGTHSVFNIYIRDATKIYDLVFLRYDCLLILASN